MKKFLAMILTLALCVSMLITPACAESELKIYLFGEAQNMDKVLDKFYAESGLDVKLNIIWNTGADHREKLPLLIGNEEPCDLVFDAYWMNLATMIKQDMYADLSSYFNNDEYPGLKAAFSESYLAQVTEDDGAIYAIPFTQAANDIQCIFYRADLAEKYGITVDSTESLEAFFKAVKENEKDLIAPFGVGGSRAMYYLDLDILEKKQANVFEISGTGTAVGRDQLAPGDIICFGNSSYVWHVGIYIGNNQFIHAPNTGSVVRVESLSGTYANNFVCAKRVV